MAIVNKNVARQKRHIRVRKRVNGTAERPRLNVYRSSNHIYAQVVDDLARKTLVSASTLDASLRADKASRSAGGNVDALLPATYSVPSTTTDSQLAAPVPDLTSCTYRT